MKAHAVFQIHLQLSLRLLLLVFTGLLPKQKPDFAAR
jgi:hypothetical protein